MKNKNNKSLAISYVEKIDVPSKKGNGLKILLLNSEHKGSQKLIRALDHPNVTVVYCRFIKDAVSDLEDSAHEFDLIVIDNDLAELSGLHFFQNNILGRFEIPVVLLIDEQQIEVAKEAIHLGIADYLIKDSQGVYLQTMMTILSSMVREFNASEIKAKIENELAIASKVFSNTTEAIMVTTPDNLIEKVNRAFQRITGYSEDEVIGKDPKFLSSGQHSDEFFESMWKEIKDTGSWKGEIVNRRKNGEEFPEWLVINTITNSENKVEHYIGIFTDISRLKKAEQKLYKFAFYDDLTKLPNRASFLDRLKHEIERNKRNNAKLALMFIDLDRFKWINDNFGHQLGDEYLKTAAQRLTECIRQTDMAARFAGDEFVVILPQVKSSNDVAAVAEKILNHFSENFILGDQDITISASIGIAMCPDDNVDSDKLIKNADVAMYRSKNSGRHTYHFFTPDMQHAIEKRRKKVAELQNAIAEKQLEIEYQPFVDIQSGRVMGAEALVRWIHPTLGLQSPANFIPLAEQTNLIIPLGRVVLEDVCLQTKHWQDAGLLVPEISINLSKLQLQQYNFITELNDIIHQTGVDTHSLVLEIKENFMMEEQSSMISILRSIKETGIKLSIDDFGTGYSSLSEIKFFPMDILKIPRPFLTNVTEDPHNAVLAETIINMAHSLNMKVVAEGVETFQQLQFLKQKQCDLGQGFLFSKGVKVDEMTRLLESGADYLNYH